MTTAAPTAAGLLRQLDARRTQAQIAALADLDAVAQAEVRRALGSVKGSARIDVPQLITSVRQSIAARAEREAEAKQSGASAWRYELELRIAAATSGDLHGLRDDLQDARERGEDDASPIMRRFLDRLAGIAARLNGRVPLPTPAAHAEPDAEPDDVELDDEPPRRAAVRIRSRAAQQRASARPKAATGPLLGGRLLGAGDDRRPYGCPIDVSNYAAWRDPLSNPSMPPPWLLSDSDEEPDEETDDVATSTRVSA
jgi:hypothetical protein